jgi:hypothetical protein
MGRRWRRVMLSILEEAWTQEPSLVRSRHAPLRLPYPSKLAIDWDRTGSTRL